MKLIVALGNPGVQYQNTRHNIGFLALDNFLESAGLKSARHNNNFESVVINEKLENQQCIFAYPQTFMNESGRAVTEIMRFYKIPPEDLIILQDEIDLPLGTVKLAKDSGDAGHNGIKSIIAHLGTMNFRRLRIGIETRIENRVPPTESFVLQPFTADELDKVPFAKINERLREEIRK